MDASRIRDLPVSVVIPALNEGQNLIDTVAVVRTNSGDLDPEVIVVDDGSTDGAPQRIAARFSEDPRVRVINGPQKGIARSRNAGFDASQGEFVVFLDGHCHVPKGWLAPLLDPFKDPQVGLTGPAFSSIRDPKMVACGITWKDSTLGNVWLPADRQGPVPFHIGACQAVRAKTFAALGGFDKGMTRWGSEDVEICLRMWLMGYRVEAAPASLVYHLFRNAHPYEVDTGLILYNHLRLAVLHFDEARLSQVVANLTRCAGHEVPLAKALANGVVAEREALFASRTHDVDWFFSRFSIGF